MLNLATPIEEYLPLATVSPDLTWHVVHTHVRGEGVATDALKSAGFEVLYPHYITKITHGRKVREEPRPYYPRYLFVGLEQGQGLYHVNEAPCVSTVLYLNEKPLVVPRKVIKRIARKCDEDGLLLASPKEKRVRRRYKRLAEGTRVRIRQGPLEGFYALVALDRDHEVRLWLETSKGPREVTVAR